MYTCVQAAGGNDDGQEVGRRRGTEAGAQFQMKRYKQKKKGGGVVGPGGGH